MSRLSRPDLRGIKSLAAAEKMIVFTDVESDDLGFIMWALTKYKRVYIVVVHRSDYPESEVIVKVKREVFTGMTGIATADLEITGNDTAAVKNLIDKMDIPNDDTINMVWLTATWGMLAELAKLYSNHSIVAGHATGRFNADARKSPDLIEFAELPNTRYVDFSRAAAGGVGLTISAEFAEIAKRNDARARSTALLLPHFSTHAWSKIEEANPKGVWHLYRLNAVFSVQTMAPRSAVAGGRRLADSTPGLAELEKAHEFVLKACADGVMTWKAQYAEYCAKVKYWAQRNGFEVQGIREGAIDDPMHNAATLDLFVAYAIDMFMNFEQRRLEVVTGRLLRGKYLMIVKLESEREQWNTEKLVFYDPLGSEFDWVRTFGRFVTACYSIPPQGQVPPPPEWVVCNAR